MADDDAIRRALYVGRFQVFHLGHLDVIRHIAAAPDVDAIVIAIGSAQYDHTRKSPAAPWAVNPFTVAERREMIERSLAGGVGKPVTLHPVPDYHDWERWFRHLMEHLPRCCCLYTSDPDEATFFAARGFEVRGFPRRYRFHAGVLRRRLADGEDCRPVLPAGAAAVLDRIDAAARLRELFARDGAGPP